MFESLRSSLLLWYSSILVVLIVAFGGAVCYLFWRSVLNELDADLRVQAQNIAQALHPAALGSFDLDLPEGYLDSFRSQPDSRHYYAIWTESGALIDRSDPDLDVQPLVPPAARSGPGVREVAVRTDGGATVLVGQDTAALQQAVWSLAGTVAAVGVFVLGLSLVGGWLLAGRVLAPIARISRTAQAMVEGDLGARIEIDTTETELGQVASALNAAFDRLGLALNQQQRFSADASHELMTPLATLLAELEWAQTRPRSVGEYQSSLTTCERAASRIRAVVRSLLTLSRTDPSHFVRQPVRLDEIVQEVVTLLHPLAAKRDVRFSVTHEHVEVTGDPDRLRELVTNLVSNAISYNREGGEVALVVSQTDGVACLQVTDTGMGIAPEHLTRVFERFFRADSARSRETGGAGLGLAVAKHIADSHHGEISCSSEVGRGTRFIVRLPAGGQIS